MAPASPGTPAEMRAYILERLTGATGEPDSVLAPARSLAERVLPILAKGLAGQFSSAVPMTVDTVELGRFADVPGSADGICAAASIALPGSSDALLLLADATVAALLVSVLFGGDPEEPATPIERALSPIESEVIALAFGEVARALNGCGESFPPVELPGGPPLAGADVDKARPRDGPAVRIGYALGKGPAPGRIMIMMPQRLLLQQRSAASPVPAEDRETEWRARFGEGVMRSSVPLVATMPLAEMTLGEVAGLQAGQVIAFAGASRSDVRLSARNRTLFVGEFGKLGQNYTVRLRGAFDERQDLIDGLMTG